MRHGPPDFGKDPEGATPIDDDQRSGLRLSWVATRGDLNAAELDNIRRGRAGWRRRVSGRGRSRLSFEELVDHQVVRQLHRDMYDDVWDWAGRFRARDVNIGVPWHHVTEAVAQLLGNAPYWFDSAGPLSVDAAAARLHHKLVEIHPFLNGNGRHAREFTDLVLVARGDESFTWGSDSLVEVSTTRRQYIDALVAADQGDYAALDNFVRT